MEKISARKIVRLAGMSDRPDCYRGRCATTHDLDGDMLYNIYQRIKKEIGTRQADAFVTMVQKLYPLSASNFLNSLYALEQCNWEIASFCNNDTERIKHSFLGKVGFERGPREKEKTYDDDWER